MTKNRRSTALARPLGLLALGLAWCAVGSAPVSAATTEAGDTLPALLQQHGIRPVEPATPAASFALPDLSGERRALSDFEGSWVVLTFFASWCGPCRAEMPSLETLHQERADNELVVLGISLDDQQASVAPFVEQLGVTFPVLWDEDGRAGRAYRANSIPITYLIDPSGRIAGVSRGARDWAALGPMLDRVVAMGGAAPSGEATYAALEDGTVDLPSAVTPPSAVVELSKDRPRRGETFELAIEIRWSGTFDEYLLHPPQVALPEGVAKSGATRAETTSRAGRNVITYSIPLAAAETGSYALDPVELVYTPRFEEYPVATRLAGPTVHVESPRWAGMTRQTLLWTGTGTTLACALAGLLFVGWRRRRQGPVAADEGAAALAGWRQKLADARRDRMQGDPRSAFERLASLLQELDPEDTRDLPPQIENVRYGGRVPSREELERLERRAELLLRSRQPDPQDAERQKLRLRSDRRSRKGDTPREPVPTGHLGS